MAQYEENIHKNPSKTVALIMAGNIPLVGFHDFLSVLLTGHTALIKKSSNDNVLFSFIIDYITSIEPIFLKKINIADGKIEAFDAVIATGSNNTARYFEHYFGKGPKYHSKKQEFDSGTSGNEPKTSSKRWQKISSDITA